MIKCEIVRKQNVELRIKDLLSKEFLVNETSELLSLFFNRLDENLFCIVEYPYVDRLYRDSYYHYFAGKHTPYKRNCIRVSFFNEKIEKSFFYSKSGTKLLQKAFLGFVIIRPIRKCIGRNILSPKALKNKNRDFFLRTTTAWVTINGVKLHVKGFPHSSQDGEVMTCAETTLWAIMEYFGNKYSEYKTTLPSKIREGLALSNHQRPLPSVGLKITSVSFLLKNFGFGSRVYTREGFYDEENDDFNEFYDILNCYIESGIPVILSLQNSNIGHAILCVGRKYIPRSTLRKLEPIVIDIKDNDSQEKIYDFDRVERELIIMDDGLPPYKSIKAKNPAVNYNIEEKKEWEDCRIDHIIVPLHNKIYLEAKQAKSLLHAFLATGLMPLPKGCKNYIRLFLTSSRSLKNSIVRNNDLSEGFKELILTTELPKFVWVTELSNEHLINKFKANGLIIFDATEADYKSLKSILLAAYNGKMLYPNYRESWEYEPISISLRPFSMFNDNLTRFK